MQLQRDLRLALAIILVAGCERSRQPTGPADPLLGVSALARAPVSSPYTEPAFYNGQLVRFLLPSAGSADPNDQVIANCFRVGPRVPPSVPINASAYILLIPGASQETICSTDGRPTGPEGLTHNHVLTAAPGSPNYNAHFRLVLVGPGPNYPGASFAATFNSEATVLAGIAAGQLVVLNPDAAHVHWAVMP
jgi:hypothetical protein